MSFTFLRLLGKLREIREDLNASNEDEPSFLAEYRYPIVCKNKNRKAVWYVLKNVSKQMCFFIKYGGKAEMKVNGKRR